MPSTNIVDHRTEHRRLSVLKLATEAGVDEPKLLSSREEGAKFLAALRSELDSARPGESLVLEFDGIRLMDASFADEALVTLALEMSRGQFKDKYIVLKDLSNTSKENLEFALFRRPDVEEKQVRNLAILNIQNGVLSFVGKLEAHLKGPWEVVSQATKTTARDLSAALDIDLSAASTKLKTLFDLHLIRREEIRDESGKQYIYSPLTES